MAKVKIPKEIAGVKIPKKARKRAKKALEATASPVVQGLAVAALASAARARAARSARKAAEAGPDAAAATEPGCACVEIDGERLAETLRAAARDGLLAFLEGLEEGLRATAPSPPPRDDEPGAAASAQ